MEILYKCTICGEQYRDRVRAERCERQRIGIFHGLHSKFYYTNPVSKRVYVVEVTQHHVESQTHTRLYRAVAHPIDNMALPALALNKLVRHDELVPLNEEVVERESVARQTG